MERGHWEMFRSVKKMGNGTELSMGQKGNEEQALRKSEKSNVSRKKRNDPKLT